MHKAFAKNKAFAIMAISHVRHVPVSGLGRAGPAPLSRPRPVQAVVGVQRGGGTGLRAGIGPTAVSANGFVLRQTR